MTQTVLTFISKVKPDQADRLKKLLDDIGDDPENNAYVPFRALKLLHFASLVLHQSPQTPEYGPYLVFENNFDGELNDYLEDLYLHASSGLHQIYTACLDYTVTSASDRQGIIHYLTSHVVLPNAYHIGNTGRSAARILQEQILDDALQAHADTLLSAVNLRLPAHCWLSSKISFAAINSGRGFRALVRGRQSWSKSSTGRS